MTARGRVRSVSAMLPSTFISHTWQNQGRPACGERFNVIIRIGQPYPVNDVSWACPVGVDGIDTRLADMHGIDSWKAMLLAVGLVRSRLEHFLETGGKLYWHDEPSLAIGLQDIFGEEARGRN